MANLVTADIVKNYTIVGTDASGKKSGNLIFGTNFRGADSYITDSIGTMKAHGRVLKQAVLLALVETQTIGGRDIASEVQVFVPTERARGEFKALLIAVLSNGDVVAESRRINRLPDPYYAVYETLNGLGYDKRENEVWIIGKSQFGGKPVKLLKLS